MSGIKRGALNATALTVSHGANALLPLVAFPHLLHVAGASAYSSTAIAESLSFLVLTISLYSFEVDGVQSVVGRNPKENSEEIGRVFVEILVARVCLFVMAGSVVLGAVAILSPQLLLTVLAWLTVPLALLVQSGWLFNGLERNVPSSIAVTGSRGFSVAAILLIVRSGEQAWLMPLLISVPALGANTFVLVIVLRTWGIRLRLPEVRGILVRLRHGWPVFLSSASVYLYRDINVLLLGVAGVQSSAIASYSIAEKLIKGMQSVARPINLALFPVVLRRISNETSASRQAFLSIARLTWPQILVVLALTFSGGVLWLRFGDDLVADFGSSAISDVPGLMLLMVPVLAFGIANFMFGTVGLNRLGERKFFFAATIGIGLGNVVLGYLAATLWSATGVAICFALSEFGLFTAIASRYQLQRLQGDVSVT